MCNLGLTAAETILESIGIACLATGAVTVIWQGFLAATTPEPKNDETAKKGVPN